MSTDFYHVTLKSNADSILKNGIEPNRSTGQLAVSWYVTGQRLWWAIAHIAAKQNCSVDDLVVFRLKGNTVEFSRTRLRGVYVTSDRRRPRRAPIPASEFLSLDYTEPTTPQGRAWFKEAQNRVQPQSRLL